MLPVPAGSSETFFLKRTQKPHKDETFGLAFLGVHSKWLIDSTSHKTVKGTLPIFLASPKLIVIVIRTCLNYALLTTLAMTQETEVTTINFICLCPSLQGGLGLQSN